MEKLEATSTLTPVAHATKRESLFHESIEGTKQLIAKLTSRSTARATKKESSSGECTSARTCEVYDIHVNKTTITAETKTLWALKAS
jgi:hypothetical protein